MATVTANTPLDMSNGLDIGQWTAGETIATTTKIQGTSADLMLRGIYYGSFSVNQVTGQVSGGTMTAYEAYEKVSSYVKQYSLSNMSIDLQTFIDAKNSLSGAGLTTWLLSGNDTINGSTGNDKLYGWAGADTIRGNAGNDTLDGGEGKDSLQGGLGNDVYVLTSGDIIVEASNGGTDTVQTSSSYTLGANLESLTLSGSKHINGAGNDLANTIVGNSGNNVLNGGAGNDSLRGGKGNDTYVVTSGDAVAEAAGSGTDTVKASFSYTLGANLENLTLLGSAAIKGTGNSLANVITGNSGNNTLNGLAGADNLRGGTGNDTLIGGSGKDTLQGGSGSDIFDFNNTAESGPSSTTRDVISDFVRGLDKIDLSGIDANTQVANNNAFTSLIASNASFTAAGQLKLVGNVLYGNTDADASAEFSVQLTGISALSLSDLVL